MRHTDSSSANCRKSKRSATRQAQQSAAQVGQTVQNTAQQHTNRETQEHKLHSQKKPIPKIAIILPVCIVAIVVIVFGILAFKDSSRTTPFTEYLSLVGSNYEELYSDAYDITPRFIDYYYVATTDISFMDIDGTGLYGFFHTEDEETLSSLVESGIETDTVLGFSWYCNAYAYSLDDVCAAFESIYGDSTLHGTYPIYTEEVEAYYWENAEGGYDLELLILGDQIAAFWYAHPDVEGSYEDVVSALEKAIENRDVSTYESLVYEGDALSVLDSLSMADLLSNEEIDQIDCSIGEITKVSIYDSSLYLMETYCLVVGDLARLLDESMMYSLYSLYIVDMDLTLYQGVSIVSTETCKIDITYIDDEWKIIGIFLDE